MNDNQNNNSNLEINEELNRSNDSAILINSKKHRIKLKKNSK